MRESPEERRARKRRDVVILCVLIFRRWRKGQHPYFTRFAIGDGVWSESSTPYREDT